MPNARETRKRDGNVSFEQERFRLIVLGAGFSKPAGLPLASELWEEIRRRSNLLTGRAEFFNEDLEHYIRYRKQCDGITLTADAVNFEEFMAFLDIEHYLGLRGKDTWSEDGNEAQVVVKTLIGEILTERTPTRDRLPDIYLRFAELLQPGDLILTFNYDILLERALDAIGKRYRLFPDRYTSVGPEGAIVDLSQPEILVLKMHGSVDWFSRKQYRQLDENRINQGLKEGHSDRIFGPPQRYCPVPIVDGPRFANDPLNEMYRVTKIEELYAGKPLFHATPWLLNPSSAKILYSAVLKEFCWGLGRAGVCNFGMAIVGFSLPPQDLYARQILYSLVKNYQENHWAEDDIHIKKPLVLIDFRTNRKTKQEYRQRYSFVDWTRAENHLGGFDGKAVDLIRKN